MTQDNLLWNEVLGLLKDRLSKPAFETWLKETKAKVAGDNWLIIAPNEFSRDWPESRYLSDIKEGIYTITKEVANVAVIVDKQSVEAPQSDLKVESILTQIEFLSHNEKTKLLSLIKSKFTQEITSSEILCEEKTTHMRNSDKSNRISNLENEVNQLRDEVTGLHTEIKFLKLTLANQIFSDN